MIMAKTIKELKSRPIMWLECSCCHGYKGHGCFVCDDCMSEFKSVRKLKTENK